MKMFSVSEKKLQIQLKNFHFSIVFKEKSCLNIGITKKSSSSF